MELQVLLHGQVWVKGEPARHIAYPLPYFPVIFHHIQPVHLRHSGVRPEQCGQNPEQCRLPSPVRPDEAEQFTPGDIETHVRNRLDVPE